MERISGTVRTRGNGHGRHDVASANRTFGICVLSFYVILGGRPSECRVPIQSLAYGMALGELFNIYRGVAVTWLVVLPVQ